jgi:hypothetical protein
MISDLNFNPSDEGNYTAEKASGSSFFARIFLKYDQSNSYPNQVQNKIYNFNQSGYYTNYPYDNIIYSHMYPYVYQQPNPAVSPCLTYILFGSSSNTYDQMNYQDNCDNLADDYNLNIFYVNLSLSRAEEQSNIGASSNIDPTVMKLSGDHDDQDEQDDVGPPDWSEVET